MDADELLVIVVLALEHIVQAVDLANLRHHAVHVANGLLRLGNGLRREATLAEERLKLGKQIDVLVLVVVEVGLELATDVLVAVFEVVEKELQFLLALAAERELHLRQGLVDDAGNVLGTVKPVKEVHSLDAMVDFCEKLRDGIGSEIAHFVLQFVIAETANLIHERLRLFESAPQVKEVGLVFIGIKLLAEHLLVVDVVHEEGVFEVFELSLYLFL